MEQARRLLHQSIVLDDNTIKVLNCAGNKTVLPEHGIISLFRCLPGIHAETPYNAIRVNAVQCNTCKRRIRNRKSFPLADTGAGVWFQRALALGLGEGHLVLWLLALFLLGLATRLVVPWLRLRLRAVDVHVYQVTVSLSSSLNQCGGSGSKANLRSPWSLKPTTSEQSPRKKHRFPSSGLSSEDSGAGSHRERGTGAVRIDEPLGKSSSLAASPVVAGRTLASVGRSGTGSLTIFRRVHLSLFGLWLVDNLEEFGVDSLSTGVLDWREYSGAELLVVGFPGAGACAFRHCEKVCESVCEVGWQTEADAW